MTNLAKIIVTLLLTVTFPICKAQIDSASNKNNSSKNVIYIEALGNGFNYIRETIWGTVNYERNIINSKKVNYSIRMGLGFKAGTTYYPHSLYSLPLMFNIMSSPYDNHHLEAGLGIVLTNDGWGQDEIGYTGSVKYRYQKKTRGIYFSAGWAPSLYFVPYFQKSSWEIIAIFDRVIHFATMGMSVGYHF